MNFIKKLVSAFAVIFGLTFGNTAHAGIPTIDLAAVGQAILQVQSWAQQYQQMVESLQQMQQQYSNLNGIRNMGSLVNNPDSRNYLPDNYQAILNNGVGQWSSIRDASKVFDISQTSLLGNSDTANAFNATAKQSALNRAAAELAYSTSSQRFANIQVLLDKVNDAPDAKDMADLQGRIQAEQVMMQNEANKLQTLQLLASAQRDLQMQQAKEVSMKAGKGPVVNGW